MKKCIVAILMILLLFTMFFSTVYAADSNNQVVENQTTDRAIDEETESQLVELKENVSNSLEDYKEQYGSDIYGTVAYILNLVRIYSIPLCFLGIAIGAIHQYVIGVRKLDTLEKGMALIVTFVTKFGRG